ncbi:MAG: type II toxin-antitoxin system VapC family toxin [Actinobacteria bacterium]|nr:type II toxin-antitoxin system VapC family toxin [Actinomycetota bacterium]
MIVDTSALVAAIRNEPEGPQFRRAMLAERVLISASTLLEAHIVVHGRWGDAGVEKLGELLGTVDAQVIAVDEAQARIGIVAARRYGRGSGHPARLNYGDCFSYALAIAYDEPLLCKGDDFGHTDVRIAV